MSKLVFISYARENAEEARTLKSCLSSPGGYDCFLDETNILASSKFREEIKKALDRSFVLIVLCSKDSKRSLEVLFEVAYAIGKGIPILPVYVRIPKGSKCFPHMEGIQGVKYLKQEPCAAVKLSLREIEDRIYELEPGPDYESIQDKLEKVGLVDIAVGWDDINWPPKFDSLFHQLAIGSELFMAGRTFMAWSRSAKGFATEVAQKAIKCRMIIADPTMPDLKSLVITDQAQGELSYVYDTFKEQLPIGFRKGLKNRRQSGGFIEIYGIPCYLPSTFTLLEISGGVKYCNLEVGIAADPNRRVPIFFQNVGDGDIYTALKHIYYRMIDDEHDGRGRKRLARLIYRVDSLGATEFDETKE